MFYTREEIWFINKSSSGTLGKAEVTVAVFDHISRAVQQMSESVKESYANCEALKERTEEKQE